MLQIDTSIGKVFYSNELIKGTIAMSAMECSGVVGLANCDVKDGVCDVSKSNINNGVKISLHDGKLDVDIFLIVKYGIKVYVIANEVIKKIKTNVENCIGIHINSITVNVQGVRFES